MTDKVAGPDGSVLSEGLGPNVPKRGECDAPICPWCERQGWDNCSHADYAKTCEVRQYDI